MNETLALFDLDFLAGADTVEPPACANCDEPATRLITSHPNLLGGLIDGFAPFRAEPRGFGKWTESTAPMLCCLSHARYMDWSWNTTWQPRTWFPNRPIHPHPDYIVVVAVAPGQAVQR